MVTESEEHVRMIKKKENTEKDRVLKIKLPPEYTDERLISEYCKDAGLDPWEVRGNMDVEELEEYIKTWKWSKKLRGKTGNVEAAMMHLDPFNGQNSFRGILLTYFFAGLKFGREHKKSDYYWKFISLEEKQKMEEKEVEKNDRDTDYFG